MAVKKLRGRWTVEFRRPDGTRVRRVSPDQTKRGAEAFETELRMELVNASSISRPCSVVEVSEEPTEPLVLTQDFAVEFLTSYAAVHNKPSEVVSKESTLRVHLLPFFGNRALSEIGSRDIARYKAAKLEEGLKASTVNNHLIVLRKMLNIAVEWELIESAPRVRALRTEPTRFDWLRPRESRKFLTAIADRYPQWMAVFVTALHCGLRRGEIFGLQWDDVDFARRSLTVRRSVYRGKLVSPKNGKTRTLPMTKTLTAAMRDQRLVSQRLGSMVFPGSRGGVTRHQCHVNRPLNGALRIAGLRRIRFHDLRHTFASQLISAGRSLKEVQELLGHATITMTLRYAHLSPDRMRDAVDVLDEGFDEPGDLAETDA